MKSITAFVIALPMAIYVTSAPAPTMETNMNNKDEDFVRGKRSQYGVQYVSPCNAAASAAAPIPSYGPYHFDVAPMQTGYSSPHYGYTGPQYRSIDPATASEQEMLGFSDMDHLMSEHIPMARYGSYDVPSHTAGAVGQVIIPAHTSSSPAYGIFPNANTGPYNVPLLFSCSPSIAQGHIVKSQPNNAYSQPAASYRGVDDQHMEVPVNRHEESGSHEHIVRAISNNPSHPSLHQ